MKKLLDILNFQYQLYQKKGTLIKFGSSCSQSKFPENYSRVRTDNEGNLNRITYTGIGIGIAAAPLPHPTNTDFITALMHGYQGEGVFFPEF